jgi:glucose dehydrogenase
LMRAGGDTAPGVSPPLIGPLFLSRGLSMSIGHRIEIDWKLGVSASASRSSKTTRTCTKSKWPVIILVGLAILLDMSFSIAFGQGAVSKLGDGDWLHVDHDLASTRYSRLKQITSKNVSQLAKVCTYSFPDKEPSQTAPIVSAGILYLTTAHYTAAVDGSDCHVIWSSKWSPRDYETFNTQRGAALAGGKIIRGTADGFLLALDAKAGHTLWARQIANPKEGYFISMPPLVHGDLVYIGPAGAEWASKGWVGAFRISDGEQVWRFNIVPDDGEPGADTWGTDPAARKHGGGNLWTPLSFDEETNLLYVPGGNPAPDIYDEARPGSNLYTNSMIALDATTGRLAWYRCLTRRPLIQGGDRWLDTQRGRKHRQGRIAAALGP